MSTEAANLRRWTDDQRGVYEVWYLTFNHAPTGLGFWLRFVIEQPDHGPARGELWFARFDPGEPARTFGVHRRFAGFGSSEAPFWISIGQPAPSELAHDRTRGGFEGDGHTIAWNLRWQPAARTLPFLPDLADRLGIAETTVISPNPAVLMSGFITVDGERYDFERATLGQTHLWGTRHAYAWAWGHCADFEEAPDAHLELLAPRLHRRHFRNEVTLPPLVLVTLDLDGTRHHFNQFRHLVQNRATWSTSSSTVRVEFSARSALWKVEGELTCEPREMVNAPYYDPDGTKLYCANTEIGDARVTLSRRTLFGWQEVRLLESHGRAHFELGSRAPDPAVTRAHVTIE
ncbi:hypothetical protein BH11MYX1_BH11MYX1_30760 [soil metagenome]